MLFPGKQLHFDSIGGVWKYIYTSRSFVGPLFCERNRKKKSHMTWGDLHDLCSVYAKELALPYGHGGFIFVVQYNKGSVRSLYPDVIVTEAIVHYRCWILHLVGEATASRKAKRRS